jgi:phosphatidylglycerol:prolipoprotein diacylglycerol transferase
MFPNLLELFGVHDASLSSYFFLSFVGYLLAVALFRHHCNKAGVKSEDSTDLALWLIVWGVIGSRLLHVVADGFFMDYVNLCVDPFLVEGRDLLARPVGELQAQGLTPKPCTKDLQCEMALWGYKDEGAYQAAKDAGMFDGLFAEPKGLDVGPACQEETGYCHPERDCLRWANFMAGGLTYYGGFIAAALYGVYFTTRYRVGMPSQPTFSAWSQEAAQAARSKVSLWWGYLRAFPQAFLNAADAAAAPIALAHALGRVGCYLGGCCFGSVVGPDSGVGVQFPQWSPAYMAHKKDLFGLLQAQNQGQALKLSLPVYPTQLYEAAMLLAIFVYLVIAFRARTAYGHVFARFLMLYGVARFAVEFLRADARGEWLWFSTSQWIALALMGIGAWMHAQRHPLVPSQEKM